MYCEIDHTEPFMYLVSFLHCPPKSSGEVKRVIITLDALGGHATFSRVGAPLLGIKHILLDSYALEEIWRWHL